MLILVSLLVLYVVSMRISDKAAFRVVGLMTRLAEQKRWHSQIGHIPGSRTYSKDLECAALPEDFQI